MINKEELIIETKKRIQESILIDNLVIFFTRVIEDLKNEEDPNLFGRVKDLYIVLNPYNKTHDHMIYEFFTNDLKLEEGLILDDVEKSYLKIFSGELKKDFHLKNPKVMKGRLNGILNKLFEKYYPNSSKIIEPYLLGRIISAVGGTTRLFKMPSSTIQLIGAEDALFRHRGNKENKSPKYGLLYYSKHVQSEKNKGKKARQIANKLAISIKIDYIQNIAR